MRKTRTLQIVMWGLLLVLLAGGCARTEKPDQIPETASITETTEVPEATSAPEITEAPETTEAPEDVSYPRTVILPCETHILLDSAATASPILRPRTGHLAVKAGSTG